MQAELRDALLEGLADACGFVLGALAGWSLGKLFGFNFMASPGYDAPALIGLAFIVLGCGVGRWLARGLLLRQRKT